MKIADGELRQLLTYDIKLPSETVRDLVADAKQTGHSLLRAALQSKLVTEAQLARAQAKRLGVPFVDLGEIPITPDVLQQLPYQIAAKHHVICFDETATSIKLAMADPRNEKARQAVKDYTHKTVRRYQATTTGLTKAIRSYPKPTTPLPFSTRDLLTAIIEQAVANHARDIHFELRDDELLVKRRDGKHLRVMNTLPSSKLRALISWSKLQIGSDVGDTKRTHDGHFIITIHGVPHNVQVSIIPAVNGEKMVLHIVPPSYSIPTLSTIGYTSKQVQELKQLIKDGRGLVIIAGDTSSETSTTLASLTQFATRESRTTVVDSLGNGTSAAQLIDNALSKRLVISGLYATSLSSALTRLMRYPLNPALMAAALRLVVVQHQLDALCSSCRIRFVPAGPLKLALQEQFGFTADSQLYRKGADCDACHNGYSGTVVMIEWLAVTPELQQLLATKADKKAITYYVRKRTTSAQQLGNLASKGLISIDEATKQLAA